MNFIYNCIEFIAFICFGKEVRGKRKKKNQEYQEEEEEGEEEKEEVEEGWGVDASCRLRRERNGRASCIMNDKSPSDI